MTWSLMDLIIVLLLVLGMLHGLVRGIGRTLGGIAGLLLGGALALWLIPLIPLETGGTSVRLLVLGGLGLSLLPGLPAVRVEPDVYCR